MHDKPLDGLLTGMAEYRQADIAVMTGKLKMAVEFINTLDDIIYPLDGDNPIRQQYFKLKELIHEQPRECSQASENKEDFRQNETSRDGEVFLPYAFPPLRNGG